MRIMFVRGTGDCLTLVDIHPETEYDHKSHDTLQPLGMVNDCGMLAKFFVEGRSVLDFDDRNPASRSTLYGMNPLIRFGTISRTKLISEYEWMYQYISTYYN